MLKYRISSIWKTAGEVKIFRVIPLGNKLIYKPGQFVMMHLLNEKGESLDRRPYSIASEPDSDYLEFCIKMIGGRFTSKLDLLKEGSIVGIEVPMGMLSYEGDKCVLICGGTGIAPIMSMVRDIAKKEKKGDFFVFYSAKKKDHLIYYDELLSLEKKNPSLKLVFTLTREEPPAWPGKCGRIDEALLREFIVNPKEYNWYICGPLEMSSSLRDCINSMGGDPKKIHLEGWG